MTFMHYWVISITFEKGRDLNGCEFVTINREGCNTKSDKPLGTKQSTKVTGEVVSKFTWTWAWKLVSCHLPRYHGMSRCHLYRYQVHPHWWLVQSMFCSTAMPEGGQISYLVLLPFRDAPPEDHVGFWPSNWAVCKPLLPATLSANNQPVLWAAYNWPYLIWIEIFRLLNKRFFPYFSLLVFYAAVLRKCINSIVANMVQSYETRKICKKRQ